MGFGLNLVIDLVSKALEIIFNHHYSPNSIEICALLTKSETLLFVVFLFRLCHPSWPRSELNFYFSTYT